MPSNLIPRNYKSDYLKASRGKGIYIYDNDGTPYIDGCCGALVSGLGHGNTEIIDAITEQYHKIEFAHPSRWSCDIVEKAATAVADFAPESLDNVWFVCGGSEAIESAIKLARQYYYERDGINTSKHLTIGRWYSYHGSTLGTMSVCASIARRRVFAPLLRDHPKIENSYCYRCPYGKTYPSCNVMCAHKLEETIRRIGAQYITSFIAEPVVGSSICALTPPKEYWPIVRDICTKYDILLIADEVMSGCGRTGENFAVNHWDVIPDIIVTAKGLAAGYVPTGAIITKSNLVEAIKNGTGGFVHGHTYNGNPICAAAVVAVLEFMKKNDIVCNAKVIGEKLRKGLEKIASENPIVGEVRGLGMQLGVELVADKMSRKPFDPNLKVAQVAAQKLIDEKLIVYPSTGTIDGIEGDNFLIAPPLVTTETETDDILERLRNGLASTANEMLL
ncbi:MAG: aminotransferase class III-fold pyridoxal phosphate-dependent enzyme [Synergistaceae bacterium]|nr:aminotransferase class III-fold pyridoxal phosphate-dependent enzyme [Synergistaceae bacterium]